MSGQPLAPSLGVRLLRGIAALVTLAGVLVGVPLILLAVGGNPLDQHVPSLHGIAHALTTTDVDGRLFIKVAIAVVWITWLAFNVSVLLDLIARLRRRPPLHLPGLGMAQRSAASLLTAIAVMLGSTGLATNAFAAASARTPVVVTIGGAHPATNGSATNSSATNGSATNSPLATGSVATGSAINGSTANGSTAYGSTARGHGLVYHVREGDQLGSIAQRFLGSFGAYHRIEAMNSGLITRGPDYIQVGWALHLPAGAHDRGILHHARGTVSPATTPPPVAKSHPTPPMKPVPGPPPPAPTTPAPTTPASTTPASTTPASTTPASTTPTQPAPGRPAPAQTPGSASQSPSQSPSQPAASPTPASPPAASTPPGGTTKPGGASASASPTPIFTIGSPIPIPSGGDNSTPVHDRGVSADLLLAASTLTVSVLAGHLMVWRRRRRELGQTSTGGAHAPHLAGGASEPLTGPGTEINRLDLALRHLASVLVDRAPKDMPDIMGSWLVDNAVHLMLTRPCPAPPSPWVAHGLMWTLPAHATTYSWYASSVALLPTLVTAGGTPDNRVLLDLERLGVASISGDERAAEDMLRHVGVELSQGVWSDGVTVRIAGFSPEDTRRLVALGEGRVQPCASVSDALDEAGRRIDEAQDRMAGLGVADVLSGRVSRTPTDPTRLSPYALLLAGPDALDLERLERLDAYLAGLGRGQIAIATTTQEPFGRSPITVDSNRQVTLDFLDTPVHTVPAVSLDQSELAALAATPDLFRRNAGPMATEVPVGPHRMNRRMPVS